MSIKSKLENIKEKIANFHSNITLNEFLNEFDEIMLNELKEEDLILIKDFFKSGYVNKILALFPSKEKDKEILVKKLKELKDKIETLESEKSQQKYINEIQKKNISDLEKKDEIQKQSISNLEKQSIEKESINKSQKQHISNIRKSYLEKQNEIINQDICYLKKQYKNNKRRMDILEKNIKEENLKFKKSLEDMILKYVYNFQDFIEKEEAIKKNKERDNHEAILYTILISIGLTFDEIYLNFDEKILKNFPKIKPEFNRIAIGSLSYLYNSDERGHASSTNNILENLFPKYSGLSKLFTDQILNGTKEVIKNLPLFKLGKIEDIEFKVKKDKITELIRNTFNK